MSSGKGGRHFPEVDRVDDDVIGDPVRHSISGKSSNVYADTNM